METTSLQRRRAHSAGNRRQRQKPTLQPESLEQLNQSYVKKNLGALDTAGYLKDPRGNLMPVKATGHIGHDFNKSTAWRWLDFTNKLLYPFTTSCCFPLEYRVLAFKRVSRVRVVKVHPASGSSSSAASSVSHVQLWSHPAVSCTGIAECISNCFSSWHPLHRFFSCMYSCGHTLLYPAYQCAHTLLYRALQHQNAL